MWNKGFVFVIVLCISQNSLCNPKDDQEEDDIFSFSTVNKKTVPIQSSQPASSNSKPSAAGSSNNPYNGIQELTNQWKDGNFNNVKKISDSNTNILMSTLGLGSNWMSTNLRLIHQWNDLNRDIGSKLIDSYHQFNDNNLRFIKKQVESINGNIKATMDPMYKQISDVRDTFNANPKDDSSNNLALVSKSGRPVETLAELKNELPSGLVDSASSWLGR